MCLGLQHQAFPHLWQACCPADISMPLIINATLFALYVFLSKGRIGYPSLSFNPPHSQQSLSEATRAFRKNAVLRSGTARRYSRLLCNDEHLREQNLAISQYFQVFLLSLKKTSPQYSQFLLQLKSFVMANLQHHSCHTSAFWSIDSLCHRRSAFLALISAAFGLALANASANAIGSIPAPCQKVRSPT